MGACCARSVRSSDRPQFLEIVYDGGGTLRGARVERYLLEKTRVVRQGPGERNYHALYAFAAGCPLDLQAESGLVGGSFAYLGGGAGAAAKATYLQLSAAFEDLNFDPGALRDLHLILGGILQAGNLEFREVEGATDDSAAITDLAAAGRLAKTLCVPAEVLADAITTKHIVTRGETFHKPLDVAACRDARDAFAKDLYGEWRCPISHLPSHADGRAAHRAGVFVDRCRGEQMSQRGARAWGCGSGPGAGHLCARHFRV